MDPSEKSVQEELDSLSSSLSKIDKRQVDIPVDYFDRMQQSVLSQVSLIRRESTVKDEPTSTIWSNLLRLFSPRMAWAFAIILLMGIGIGVFLTPSNSSQDYLAYVSESEMNEYLLDEATDEDLLVLLENVTSTDDEDNYNIEQEVLIEHIIDDLYEEDIEDLF